MGSIIFSILAKLIAFLVIVGLVVGAVGCISIMFRGRGKSGSASNTGGLPWL